MLTSTIKKKSIYLRECVNTVIKNKKKMNALKTGEGIVSSADLPVSWSTKRVFGLLVCSSVTWLPDWLAQSWRTNQPASCCLFSFSLWDSFFLSIFLFFWTFFFLELLAPKPLEDAATLLLLLAARPVFVFALRHLLFADLAHEIEEDLQAEAGPTPKKRPAVRGWKNEEIMCRKWCEQGAENINNEGQNH